MKLFWNLKQNKRERLLGLLIAVIVLLSTVSIHKVSTALKSSKNESVGTRYDSVNYKEKGFAITE